MAGNNFVASIDIGTEKIALLAADIEDAGHLPTLEQPKITTIALASWLEDT